MTDKPKVLQINKLYSPWIGGVEKVVQDIAEGLKDEVDIAVLACQPKGFGEEGKINGVRVHQVASFGVFWGMPISISFPFQFAREIRDYDILHFHLPFPLGVFSSLVTPSTNKKVVVTYHSDIVRQESVMKFYRPLLDRFLERADRILPTSPQLAEKSTYLEPFRDKCKPVPLSINLEKYGNSSDGSSGPEDIDKDVVLFVGRLSYYKGVDVLIEAMENVEAQLLVVGEGGERKRLERKSRELFNDDRVRFLGEVSDSQLKGLYRSADVFVLPSIEKSEAFGLVQLEAMAYGTPVVNTSLPTGVPYVSKHGETGLTVKPGDPHELAAAMNRVLGDEELADKFGENGKRRVNQKFSRENMLDSIKKVYLELS